jgi:phage/plasmid-like protein (TIGR03299 family)
MTDHVQTMFSFREMPWHGKGNLVDHALTAKEAIIEGGLDWLVELAEVTVGGVLLDDYFATVRQDTGKVLGIVGKRYHVVQNGDLFTFFNAAIDPEKGAIYHTAGVLKEGKRVWILAKVPGDFYVPGVEEDLVQNYILLASAHDGSMHVTAMHTPVRVVCWNTLSMALSGRQTMVKIRHTASASYELAMAHTVLGLATRRIGAVKEAARALAGYPVDGNFLKRFLRVIFPSKPERRGEGPDPVTRNKRARVEMLFEAGNTNTLHGMEHTGWALYNAVAEFADHDWAARRGTDTLDRSWFGSGDRLKLKAFDLLMKQLGGKNWEEA